MDVLCSYLMSMRFITCMLIATTVMGHALLGGKNGYGRQLPPISLAFLQSVHPRQQGKQIANITIHIEGKCHGCIIEQIANISLLYTYSYLPANILQCHQMKDSNLQRISFSGIKIIPIFQL